MNVPRGKISALAALLAVAAVSVNTAASAGRELSVGPETIEMMFSSRFSPKAVSRTTPTPIALALSATPRTLDGSHQPALQELTLRFDKSLALDTEGLPACDPRIQYQAGARAEERCKTALVGRGSMNIETAILEMPPIATSSKMVLWNGGTKAGVTKLYAEAHLTVPTPAALIATIEIRKIQDGRFGTEMKVSIPKIAGGTGSVTSFKAEIYRRFFHRGQPASVATLKCPDGKIQTHADAKFADGTQLGIEVVRPCIPKS